MPASPRCSATEEHGHWRIAPRDPEARVTRRYRPNTLILETRFECSDGAVTLVDFMPHGRDEFERGPARGRRARPGGDVRASSCIRFGYGAIVPWVTRLDDGTLRAVAGPDMVVLRTPVDLVGQNMKTIGEFKVAAGETVPFVLTYAPSHLPPPEPVGATCGARGDRRLLDRTGRRIAGRPDTAPRPSCAR